MTTEGIDYQALYEQVTEELATARITILKMRQARSPLRDLDMDSVRMWLTKNYVVIVVALLLFSFILSSLKTIKGLFTSKE